MPDPPISFDLISKPSDVYCIKTPKYISVRQANEESRLPVLPLRIRRGRQRVRCIYSNPPYPATKASISGMIGMKFAQPCLVTTMAPQALPNRADLYQLQPCT